MASANPPRLDLNYSGFGKDKEIEQKPFNFDLQLKHSLTEVLERSKDNSLNNNRLFSIASNSSGPSREYLQMKRNSVFQKNVDIKGISTFVAPFFPKSV